MYFCGSGVVDFKIGTSVARGARRCRKGVEDRAIYASIPYFASRFHNSTHQAGRQAAVARCRSSYFHFVEGPTFVPSQAVEHLRHLHTRQLARHLNFSADKVRLKRCSATNYRAKCDAFEMGFDVRASCISYGWIYQRKWKRIARKPNNIENVTLQISEYRLALRLLASFGRNLNLWMSLENKKEGGRRAALRRWKYYLSRRVKYNMVRLKLHFLAAAPRRRFGGTFNKEVRERSNVVAPVSLVF